MADKILVYSGRDIEISYDVRRCIHAGECANGLPEVFDPKARPWVNPDGATADTVAEVIRRCPTGALQYRRIDQGAEESAPGSNTVTIAADGPVYLHGRVRVLDSGGNLMVENTRVALCRCGASKNKPFCDNSHTGASFQDAGDIADPSGLASEERTDSAALEVSCFDDGPFQFKGAMTLKDGFGDQVGTGNSTFLCRCGASQNKPFCDGSHKRIGFRTE